MERLTLYPLFTNQGNSLRLNVPQSPLTRLTMSRDYRVFAQFDCGPARPSSESAIRVRTRLAPEGFVLGLFNDEGMDDRSEDTWGPLRYAMSEDFAHLQIPADSEPPNAAVKAFLDALPAGVPIILFWD